MVACNDCLFVVEKSNLKLDNTFSDYLFLGIKFNIG